MMIRGLFPGVTATVCLAFVASCGGGSAASGGAGDAGADASAAAGAGGGLGGAGGAAGNSSDGGAIGSSPDGGAAGSSAGGTAGTSAGVGGSTAGTAGQGGAAGGLASSLTATWTFPSLIKTNTVALSFPTYVAHLLGKTITEPFPTDFACVSISNRGASAASAHVEVSMGTYGPSTSVDVSVPANAPKKTCLTPTFNKGALYALTAPDTATLSATAKDSTGADVGSSSVVVTIPPVDDVAWSDTGVDLKTLNEMSGVYVEPNAVDIDKLQRLAQQYSVFSQWRGPYERVPYKRTTGAISPGSAPAVEDFVIEPSEAGGTLSWDITTVDCSICTNPTVDVAIFSADQWTAFQAGTSTAATGVWSAQPSGSTGMQMLSTAGQYFIAFFNNQSNFTDRTVAWSRSVLKEDVVRDVLVSTFSALRAAHLTYSTVADTFFTGWQHVRRVTQSLETASANCIDGSFVFSSVAELLGMQPVLIYLSHHAFMGIRSAPGSSVIWPIETTQVGATTSPFTAYQTAMSERAAAKGVDPMYQEIDIATLRGRGVTPLVQQ